MTPPGTHEDARLFVEIGAAIILVGHDMGLMAQVVDRLGVMYAGTLAEVCDVKAMFREPLHPYSQALIASLPTLDRKGALRGIPGLTPSLLDPPRGCSFRARCPKAMERCAVDTPRLREVQTERFVACHLYAADDAASRVDTAESSTRAFDVPSWVVLVEATTLAAAERARADVDDAELRRLDVRVRADAAAYSLEICRLAA